MTDEPDAAKGAAQARRLREQAEAGGLRFDAYLPPDLAVWLLDLIERGMFTDPSEPTFALIGEQQELEPHADLRQELERRSVQAASDDLRPGIPRDEAIKEIRVTLTEPRLEPAVWQRKAPRARCALPARHRARKPLASAPKRLMLGPVHRTHRNSHQDAND